MIRLIVPILFLLGLDFYVFQAIELVTEDWSSIPKYVVFTIYWMIPVMATIAFIIFAYKDTSKWNKNIVATARAFFFIMYFSKFLVLMLLLLDDIRLGLLAIFNYFTNSEPDVDSHSNLTTKIALIIGSIPLVSLLYGILRNPYRYKIFKETVAIKDLPAALEGLRIVQISDVHSGSFTRKEPIKKGIQFINEQEADLVFFTGDLVNNISTEMNDYMDVFDKIRAKHGVYSVLGNHDYGDYVRWQSQMDKKRNLDNLKNIHGRLGWKLLLNEHRLLTINGKKVAVIGVENYSASARFSKYGDLQKAYQGSSHADLKLLLSHDPSHWLYQVTKNYPDIDITFSGHTHGMQFGIEWGKFFKWSPVQYVYKQWAGLYQEGQQYLYVNRGFGFLAYPGRVGILPEITVIDVIKA